MAYKIVVDCSDEKAKSLISIMEALGGYDFTTTTATTDYEDYKYAAVYTRCKEGHWHLESVVTDEFVEDETFKAWWDKVQTDDEHMVICGDFLEDFEDTIEGIE
jgi:hypothetical protein